MRSGGPIVGDPMVLDRLEVRGAAGHGLGPLGRLDGNHAWLHIEMLRDAAAEGVHADAAEWRASFDQMIAYATGKGWVSDDGRDVRAHVDTGDRRQT